MKNGPLIHVIFSKLQVRQSVEGLNATDEERDSIIVDVEPVSGYGRGTLGYS